MNPGGRGCSEPRLRKCTPAWVIRERLHLKKIIIIIRKRKKKKREEGSCACTGHDLNSLLWKTITKRDETLTPIFRNFNSSPKKCQLINKKTNEKITRTNLL